MVRQGGTTYSRHGRLLTRARKKRMNLTDDDTCLICGEHSETILHAMRDCAWTKAIWSSVVFPYLEEDDCGAFHG